MVRIVKLLLMPCMFLFLSCADNSSERSPDRNHKQLDLSRSRDSVELQALREQLKTLRSSIWTLQAKVGALEEDDAAISTDGSGYGRAVNAFGTFIVLCKGVTPYLDGYKVRLGIGNLTSATYHGAKIKIAWQLPMPESVAGETEEQTNFRWSEFSNSAKEKEFVVTNVFYPGRYTQVEIVLLPAKEAEIRSLRVGLAFDILSLPG